MNPKIAHWSGKRVWLIGASSGIGEALARQLHALGARLALSSRHRERLDALGLNGALTLPCDATDEASLLGARAALLLAAGLTTCFYQTFTTNGIFGQFMITEADNSGSPVRAMIRDRRIGQTRTVADQQMAKLAQTGRVF